MAIYVRLLTTALAIAFVTASPAQAAATRARSARKSGCDHTGIGVVQPASALLSVAVRPATGQSFPFWTEPGSFAVQRLADSYSGGGSGERHTRVVAVVR